MTEPHIPPAVEVIAEAGVNHDGCLETALELVDVAAAAGADMVKFQTFRAARLVTDDAPKADYQVETTGGAETQAEMLRRLELSPEDHEVLLARCREKEITFLSTPFDEESLDLLAELGVPAIKLGSGEVTNGPLLVHAARRGLPVLLSTGMSSLGEVEAALGALAFGYTGGGEEPGRGAFLRAYMSPEGQAAVREKVTLLHCTSQYPTPPAAVNLGAMETMARAFGVRVGYSDHTLGLAIPMAAVARGARVLEKHYTLDRSREGPDHRASLEPDELAALVRGVREVAAALGDGVKIPAACEGDTRRVVRRSLVTSRAVEAGETWTRDMIAWRRPGTGLSPMRLWERLGRPASRPYAAGEALE